MPRPVLAALLAGAAALAAAAPSPALAADRVPEPVPARVFAADSPFYRQLPADTPTAADSADVVGQLVRSAREYYGTPTHAHVDISTQRWTPSMYVAHATDPVVTFRSENCQGKGPGWDADLLGDHLAGVHLPADARPDPSGDGSMVVYDPDTDTVTETWVTKKLPDGTWSACWGGTIRDASHSAGQHRSFYGVSASGLSMAGFAIRPEELAAGHIDHVVALNVPHVRAGVHAWPATRGDGTFAGPAPAEGQLMRLPASLDLGALHLSPVARTIARAAQQYGVMVTDTGGSVTFVAQNDLSYPSDPYAGPLRGRWAFREMDGDPDRGEGPFPLDRLVALPIGYRVPTDTAPAPAPAPTSAPAPVELRQSTSATPVTDETGAVWAGTDTGALVTDHLLDHYWYRSVAGTATESVYRTNAWAVRHYGATVPDGRYAVTLLATEDYWDGPGRRVFDVLAEGRTVLRDVDLWARTGGRDRADEETFDVTVTDGHLDLDWVSRVDNAVVSAVHVVRVG